jgi:hypothetical protein
MFRHCAAVDGTGAGCPLSLGSSRALHRLSHGAGVATTLVLRKASNNNVILADSSAGVYAVVVGVGPGRVMLFVDHLLGRRQLGRQRAYPFHCVIVAAQLARHLLPCGRVCGRGKSWCEVGNAVRQSQSFLVEDEWVFVERISGCLAEAFGAAQPCGCTFHGTLHVIGDRPHVDRQAEV